VKGGHGKKVAKKGLKTNGSIEGRSSSELERCVGFLGKVKNGVGCANMGEDRECLGMVSAKGGIGLKWGEKWESGSALSKL
jgi:hypothetical protein